MKQLKEDVVTAIKGLTRRKTIKLEHLRAIEIALSNPDFDENFWFNIFKNNAHLALQEQIYTLEMVHLLTLRAVILPYTLPEFITWLITRKGKDQNHYQLSLQFQEQILNLIKKIAYKAPYLSQKIDQGVLLAIILLIDKPQTFKGVFWLLQDKKRLWGKFYQDRIKQYIDYDLSLMSQCFLSKNYQQLNLSDNNDWIQLWQKISLYWQRQPRLKPNPQYKPLAQLFEALTDYQISAFFYHIALGKVPEKVFNKLVNYGFCSVLSIKIYDLNIYRCTNLIETFFLSCHNSVNSFKNRYNLNNTNNLLFQNDNLIKTFFLSLIYLSMWAGIHFIFLQLSGYLKSQIILVIPIILNLPLAIIFIFFLTLTRHWLGIIPSYFLYFTYRFIWFKEKPNLNIKDKILFRLKEFFIWAIVTAILSAVIHILYYLVSF